MDCGGDALRITWLSNAPWAPSGYGEQTGMFTTRLQALGHEVAVAANYGLNAAVFPYGDILVYPAGTDWGNPDIGTIARHHQTDLVISLCDSWVLKPDVWPDDLRVAAWTPVDHYPVPPAVLAVLQHGKVTPIAMSRFGETWMRRMKLDPLYVPHGIDTQMFKPRPEQRDKIRDQLGIPRDAFLVGMVAANKGNPAIPRKGFPQALDAFARFANNHPDAWMYLHTQGHPTSGQGIALDTLAVAVGCPQDRVRFPPDEAWTLGMSKEIVANLYNAFDVLLNPSMGEGFGIPVLEAQACGVPVICSNHSAMIELTHAGWLVDGDPWWDALQESFFYMPSIPSIVTALEASYEARDDQGLKDAAAAFALGYDADVVTEQYWKPALERLAEPRVVPPLVLNGNRAQRRAQARKQKVA